MNGTVRAILRLHLEELETELGYERERIEKISDSLANAHKRFNEMVTKRSAVRDALEHRISGVSNDGG